MKINHNIAAMNTYRQLAANQANSAKNLEKLSSGMRINKAADDAAGLSISEKMRSQIRGLDVAERNALDGISLIQTAEGALSSVTEILQRMRELAVQSSTGTNTTEDRDAIQTEITQLKLEIDRISDTTEFNKQNLMGANTTFSLMVGANAAQTIDVAISKMDSAALGLTNVNLTTAQGANTAITTLDAALKTVMAQRSSLGAMQNRLEYTVENLSSMNENITAAESRIRDVDMALEMTEYTKNNILNQSAQAMLAQANQMPQGVLKLLQ